MYRTYKPEPVFKPEYDDEPVAYCADCHSLSIKVDEEGICPEWDGCYCSKCGSTEIRECSIQEWLKEEERLNWREDE